MGKLVGWLVAVLILLIVGYFVLSLGDDQLKGGFIATAAYLIKKLADQIEEMIDQEYKIKNNGGENAK